MTDSEGVTPVAGVPRQSYFKYKVLDDPTLQHKLSGRGWWHRQQASCEGWSESLGRLLRFLGFLVAFCGSLFRAMAPWCLAGIEAGTMILLWFLMTPHRLKSFSYTRSLDDLVLLSVLRFPAVLLAYAFGLGHRQQRPYWYTALVCAFIGYTYVGIKLCFLQRALRPAPLAVVLAFLGFCTAHVLIARDVMLWARRRYEMGLIGFGYPWEEGEAQFVRTRKYALYTNKDVPSRALADADSKFLSCCGLDVHYKEAFPEVASAHADTCIILTHGFGAGVFAWRHVMQPLANTSGCRVLAFDRAGFGLTSRPVWSRGSAEPNPYSNAAQADLIQKLCSELNLHRVFLAGHADGALIALIAAAQAARHHETVSQSNDDAAAEAGSSSSRSDSFTGATQANGRASLEGVESALGVTSRHSRRGSLADIEGQSHVPEVVGLALLHPCFCGEGRPQLAKLLGHSRLGRRLLRSLLRSEVGVVAHRRAWHDSRKLTAEVLQQYKAPLQVEGWDRALIEVGNASRGAPPSEVSAACRAVSAMPVLVVVGASDRITPNAANVARSLVHSKLSILPSCGHLSHEETPGVLVGSLGSFVGEARERCGKAANRLGLLQ